MKMLISITAILVLLSCRENTSPPEIGYKNSSLHAVQSKRLRGLMTQLNDLIHERMLTEAEIDKQRRLRTEEMAKIAAKMKLTAKKIPLALPTLKLSPEEQAVFLSLSQKLQNQLDLLKLAAEQHQTDQLNPRLVELVKVCNQCHGLFRQLPVE